MSTTPTVLVAGFAYRLSPEGLEHTRASMALTGEARWIRITVETETTRRATAALQILTRGLVSTELKPSTRATAFQTEVRADLAPPPARLTYEDLTFPEAMSYPDRGTQQDKDDFLAAVERKRRRDRENARDVARINAKHGKLQDGRAIAAAKGLKIWNGGGMGVVSRVEAASKGVRDTSSVHVYACARSRAALLSMICAYNGVPDAKGLTIGVQAMIKERWTEGAWGNHMAGIEPEPGLWVQWKSSEAPVRVWPKESAK